MSTLSALAEPKRHAPLPNSYWVVPGRLLAGDHPCSRTLSETADRLQALLFSGVTLFIDLTEEGEASDYDHLLTYATGAVPLKYVRHEIRDREAPRTQAEMQEILNAIDAHLAQNSAVYVHCKSGLGRTATVIGCYLARSGLSGDEAIDRLNDVYSESEAARVHKRMPETDAQSAFIRSWKPNASKAATPPQAKPTPVATPRIPSSERLDRFAGALIGMAIGEAMGALVPTVTDADLVPVDEVLANDLIAGGPRNLPRGAWLSDTAMCWCLAESYLSSRGFNAEDQMRHYLAWQNEGKYASDPGAVDVPLEVVKALSHWQATQDPLAGAKDAARIDSHALARTAAVVLYHADNPIQAMNEAADATRTTTQAPFAVDANRIFATLLLDALEGVEKETLVWLRKSDNAQQLRRNKFKTAVLQVMDGWWRGPVAPARTGGDPLSILKTVLWAFERTANFREGVILAANLSGNPASSGAAFGALAGAYYGVQSIPQQWRSAVLQSQPLADLAYRLATHG